MRLAYKAENLHLGRWEPSKEEYERMSLIERLDPLTYMYTDILYVNRNIFFFIRVLFLFIYPDPRSRKIAFFSLCARNIFSSFSKFLAVVVYHETPYCLIYIFPLKHISPSSICLNYNVRCVILFSLIEICQL